MKNIVLSGMMGSGKTTVASCLAQAYGLDKVDTDEEIVKEHGPISMIFEEYGEEAFRNIESAVTAKIAKGYLGAVISLGGGCVLRAENVRALRESGIIFYLRTSPEEVIKRISGDKTRPLLKGGLEERVRAISAARSAIYEGAADYIVDTDGLTPREVAEKIMSIMRKVK